MEHLAVNVAGELLKLLASQAKEEVGLLWNFKGDLSKMDKTLARLKAVLQDAESRSNKEETVRQWLADIRDACYDIQDMVDHYRQENDNGQLRCAIRVKVCVRNFYSRVVLACKMKSMRARLNNIADLKDKYALKEIPVLTTEIIDKNRETFSAPECVVLGRDEEHNEIVNMIINNQTSESIFVIPIIGMGGLGKTTLAKLIFNDSRIRDSKHFDIWAWAYIGSIEFDLCNVGSRILLSLSNSVVNMHNLENISQQLKNEVEDKRFFIVLDDVWNVDKVRWDEMVDMLINSSKGSTIVVTTRIQNTATDIASNVPYRLNTLSDDNCILLFQQKAFQSEDEMNKYPNLVSIGKEIAKKCGGVALVANALGSLLRSNRDQKIWSYVRDSENLLESSTSIPNSQSQSDDRILSVL